MNQWNTIVSEEVKEAKLPWRDWFLLPLLSLFTIGLTVISMKSIAGHMFWASKSTVDSCLSKNTASGAIPSTVCWQKDYDTVLSEYRFNSCGHRAGMECEEKKKGVYRVVLIGSSVSFGMSVPREKTFAALLPTELSRLTGRVVEVYNASMLGDFPPTIPRHLDAALALHPDLILWVVTTPDIKNTSAVLPHDDAPESVKKRNILARAIYRVQYSLATNSAKGALTAIFEHGFVWLTKTPTGVMLCHILYSTPSQYLRAYLQGRDSEYGFLKTEPSEEWKSGVQEFAKIATEVESKTKAAGVPILPRTGNDALHRQMDRRLRSLQTGR